MWRLGSKRGWRPGCGPEFGCSAAQGLEREAVGGQGEGSRPSGMEQLQEDMELEEDEQRLEEKLEQIRLSHPGQERVPRKCQVLER